MSATNLKAKPSTRKIAAFVLAALGIAGLSAASAATLNLESQTLGAGSVDVAACQEDAVNVSFVTDFIDGEYKATAVKLANVSDACESLKYKVIVNGADEMAGTVPVTSENAFTLNLSKAQSAAAISNVDVVFYN